ncbi:protein yippee-like 2 isoform X1 [Astyanax mexicanus]|uniref:protein yippee-like 2 isoform X1 n=1 Tax=Astyanax mexicanus TaxID=7994 RepID=UPI0020CB5809|nr:protein yippee-like 2 isoform X1 [Astyanax mexicanus]
MYLQCAVSGCAGETTLRWKVHQLKNGRVVLCVSSGSHAGGEYRTKKGLFHSESFQGSQGRAYLFNSVVNVGCGPAEERVLLTGLHAVADIYCENCKTTLGWKYEHAFESSQKYKEGKFIIELAHMIKDNGWD